MSAKCDMCGSMTNKYFTTYAGDFLCSKTLWALRKKALKEGGGMKKRLKTVLVTLIFIWLTMGLLALARYIT